MTTFVQTVVNVPAVSGIFDYAIPESLAGTVGVGHLVIVPFGTQTVQGVIFRFIDQPSVPNVKEVIELVDPEPVLTQTQIALAEAMAQHTLSPLASIVGLFLPVGLSQQVDTLYTIRETEVPRPKAESATNVTKTNTQKLRTEDILLNVLRTRGGSLRGRQIDTHFAKVDWRKTAQYLVRKGVLSTQSVLPPSRVKPKFIKTAQLAASPDVAESAMNDLGKTNATQMRREKALKFLMRAKDAVNVSWVYAESGCNLADLQELEERELIVLRETEIWRDPLGKVETKELEIGAIKLTNEQRAAWQEIDNGFREIAEGKPIRPFLLDGVTGSGKTELYIRAAQEAIRRGRQAIILVPEIALTPQTVRRFLSHFPGQVGLIHSKLSEGERYDTWRRSRAGLLKIIIGARSALFAPLPNIGLIVADECHDSSYFQSEPPFYHAVTAAQTYARLAGAMCILGSATPSVPQRYQAENSPLPLGQGPGVRGMKRLELPRRIVQAGLPPVHIVDMRDELKSSHRGIFSRYLLAELESTLKRGEQAILFLNRRGTATYIFCRDCGYVLRCPDCETPLTFHIEDKERLLCHQCGYERGKPKTCPECGGKQIREYGLGSEKVETEVNALFPKARTLRWDWDTTRQKDAHEMILTHFAAHRADVLVGTQMLAKGLDLPLVTLVGIVLADVGLHLPDPFAGERVFQVLTQVAGRAGRSERSGKVVLQTFDPTNQVIQSASRHDVNDFYQYELGQRKRLGYPPFSRLVRLEYRHHDPAKAEEEAHRTAKKLSTINYQSSTMIGPVPCFFAKVGGYYRWQIVLRGTNPKESLSDANAKLDGWRVEVDPVSLL
jgi:primosomal protein N' (replication factor Y) (superfamily II helicase)